MAGTQRFTANQVINAIVAHKGLLFLSAKALGCSYRTVLNYAGRYTKVREAIDAARGELLDLAESKLYESVERGEPWGVTLVLRTLGRERGYVPQVETKTLTDHEGLASLLDEARRNGTAHDA